MGRALRLAINRYAEPLSHIDFCDRQDGSKIFFKIIIKSPLRRLTLVGTFPRDMPRLMRHTVGGCSSVG